MNRIKPFIAMGIGLAAMCLVVPPSVCNGQASDSGSQSLGVNVNDSTPVMQAVPQTSSATVATSVKDVFWQSSEFLHRDLLFEDACWERNGISARPRIQPAVSGLKFFARAAIYPFSIQQKP